MHVQKVGWAARPEQDDTALMNVKEHINQIYAQVGLTDRKL